jgi:ATP-dependent Lhr-like helicase
VLTKSNAAAPATRPAANGAGRAGSGGGAGGSRLHAAAAKTTTHTKPTGDRTRPLYANWRQRHASFAPAILRAMFAHPAVRTWFERRFPHGATEAQALGWPAIAAGQDTLIAAPTGSGKTLAAFLVCIDRLYAQPVASDGDAAVTQIVYVSPLKALAVDIQQNLETPLREIAAIAAELGMDAPELRVAVRSGDTTAASRSAMTKRPPHILITTPESLYLLLTAERSRALLQGVRTLIVDEIHALARDKRGAHLALSLERLEHVCRQRPTRIGLSATQRPVERIARLLSGVDEAGAARPCTIVDTGHRRALDLAIELPGSELSAVASNEQVGEVLDQIAALVQSRRTTLVFVNTRRLSERIAHALAERLGEDKVAAHHGSLSKERRLRVEARLRQGELRAVVATASLELGIDVGPVELVCQIGSPRSIATLLQRVGRSGHSRFGMPVGRLFPLTRDELCECAALLRAVRGGRLDAIALPDAPLDILAQQIVAECAAEDWSTDALFALMRRSAPYAELERAAYDEVVELVSSGVQTGRGRRAAYVQHDRVNGVLKGRRGARLSALTSGGAIPETADYRVVADPDETFVGTINEDFAIESMIGDVFLLGSTSWRIRRVERGTVRVVDAQGATPTVPFWLGEAPSRTIELSEEVSALRAGADAELDRGGLAAAQAWLAEQTGSNAVVSGELAGYLAASRAMLGVLPTQRDLVFERFFDDTGGMQLVVHAPFGGRVNRALGLLLRKRFCTSFDFELQAAANDDAIVLSLGPQHSFPLEDMPRFLNPGRVREALVQAALATPMFGVRWRWNLNRALIVLRWKGGKRNPPQIQRMESDDVMVSVFPSLAACQDNATGPREIPDHVLVRQTLNDCMTEAMDLPALEQVLAQIKNGELRVHFRDTTEPSPLAHEILNSRPYTFLDDAPLEERRTRAVQMRRGLPVEARALAALDGAAIARVRGEAKPEPRDADELHDWLQWLVVCRPREEWQAFFTALVEAGRALQVEAGSAALWCALEKRAAVQALFGDARFVPDRALPNGLRGETPDAESAARDAVRGHLDTLGPSTALELAQASSLSADAVHAALARLEAEGFALRGRFDADAADDQWCARRLLGRIHAYTQERLRREIEPVTAQDFMRFVLRWQHAEPGQALHGPRGVLQVIEQLQGFDVAASVWESQVLPARVEGYRREWLDALCLSGQVTWGRLTLPQLRDAQRNAMLSRVTPIALAMRADWPWLCAAARDTRSDAEPREDSARVSECLRERGALFFAELAAHTGLPDAALRDALWDCVARGSITSDGFQALRTLLAPARGNAPIPAPRRGLRHGARGAHAADGRWALFPEPAAIEDRDELAEAVAEQLLSRWGVVFRDLFAHEGLAIAWRDVLWALRRLEARGSVRGGRFVRGFVGEQYALPEAVELLRGVRRIERSGVIVRVSACDPLNLAGVILPGPRIPALRTNVVTYRDGALVREDADEATASAAEFAAEAS